MIVDKEGKIFENRRKSEERRTKKIKVSEERRNKDRRQEEQKR